jgi:3-hydroxyacyl-CoA dehydrogenase/enoyl-CoA hydratase/3-hydroxybutyryl-CoA epimerase
VQRRSLSDFALTRFSPTYIAVTGALTMTPTLLPALKDWRLTLDIEGIAWAVLDREGERVNSLSRRVLEELNEVVSAVEQGVRDKSVRGLVFLSGKESFIVGADVREFEAVRSEAEVTEAIHLVLGILSRIERLEVPAVSAIHGFCLGGGLELALACHYRIATRDDTTRLGFPEVLLGIFPGFNGTARSIRQAGPVSAMRAMLSGQMLRPTAARSLNLVDELVPSPHKLRWAARNAVLKKRRSKGAGAAQTLMRQWPARDILAKRMRAEVEKRADPAHYPAPYRLIELFEKHGGDLDRMGREETRYFAPLLLCETSRNLRRVFALREMLKDQAPKDGFSPVRVHVIGAGTMGADIATHCVASGMEVSLQDLDPDVIRKAQEGARKQFQRRYRGRRAEIDAASARLLADPKGEHVPRADVVIEAVVERLEVKQSVFKALASRLKPGAVMATNTSSIPLERIADGLADPGRLIGIHFFNPVAQMPLVEVVRGAGSREEEIRKGCGFVSSIDKLPLIVKSSPGFLVNRVLGPYLQEAMARLDRGVKRETIDEAAKAFGMPMGPLEVADTVGLDVCAHVAETLGLDKGAVQAKALRDAIAAGHLGKKTGQGFYNWQKGKPVKEKIEVARGELEKLGAELVLPLIAECEKCLAEGVVANADMIDAGVIFGSGFAPFRGGPLNYARGKAAGAAGTGGQGAAVARAAE